MRTQQLSELAAELLRVLVQAHIEDGDFCIEAVEDAVAAIHDEFYDVGAFRHQEFEDHLAELLFRCKARSKARPETPGRKPYVVTFFPNTKRGFALDRSYHLISDTRDSWALISAYDVRETSNTAFFPHSPQWAHELKRKKHSHITMWTIFYEGANYDEKGS